MTPDYTVHGTGNGGLLEDMLDLIERGGHRWNDALCREYPHLEFVPDERASADHRHAEQLQVCGRCLVRVECLAVALADPELLGIWGGTTTSARKAIRKAAS
jgi:WhiB family redox-sensing transcriptional regulator